MINRMIDDVFFTIGPEIQPTALRDEISIFKWRWTFD